MLYSKNGSIPYPYNDGTDGWIEVPDKPTAPEGKEVVWWYPPGWVIRDPQPIAQEGYVWVWSQTEEEWREYPTSGQSNVDSVITSITASDTITFS
jgi:hypothetical protein